MQAIYVRQSVDKKDSISIENQIEHCESKLLSNEPHQIYDDKGYSGKNTDRPQFKQMMKDIESGEISRVIIYKLDRISRSILDFANMMLIFEKNGVSIISCNDSIDTSTPSGRAMLTVTMTFAQLERETIQQRITDSYYSRAEKGFYIGGPAPFGYDKVETTHQGKKTKKLVENKIESPFLKKLFNDCLNGVSLNEMARQLNKTTIRTRHGKTWNPQSIGRILRNPVYVKANADVYNYLVGLGGTMNNPIEDYTGKYGCYVYGKREERTGTRFKNLTNDYVTLALHEGMLDPSMWLKVQYNLGKNQDTKRLGLGHITWLQGIVKCSCGYRLYGKRKINRWEKEYRYLYCRGRGYSKCGEVKNMRADKVENVVEDALLKRLHKLKKINHDNIIRDTPEINALKIQVTKIDEQIDNLIKKVAGGEDITIQFLNEHIETLNTEKVYFLNEIVRLELRADKIKQQMKLNIDDVLNGWVTYDFDTKNKIAKEMIDEIVLEGENISIIFY